MIRQNNKAQEKRGLIRREQKQPVTSKARPKAGRHEMQHKLYPDWNVTLILGLLGKQ